jgi:RimJ/RimL family protein N-acetyltransferase
MHGKRVRSAQDIERLRVLRNECRKFMTGDTKVVSKKKQAAWWAEAPRRALLWGNDAFVYIKREDGVNWITLGISKEARGTGIGTMIYHTYKGCFARIRKDNLASIRAAQKAGYVKVTEDDDTVVMA